MASNIDVKAIATRDGSTQDSLNQGLDMITTNSFIDTIRVSLIRPMREPYECLMAATFEKLFEVGQQIFRDGMKHVYSNWLAEESFYLLTLY